MKRVYLFSILGGLMAAALFAAPSAEAAIRTVQPGDSLSKVYGSRWRDVCAINALSNCNLIYVGQQLEDGLGGSTTAVAGVSASRPVPQSNSGRVVPTHRVLGGYYVMGGTGAGGGFDCSGLTQYLARAMGHSISRTSYTQLYDGRPISRAELWPGDLVIMNGGGHVAMYVGNSNVIHAVNPSEGIRIHNLDYAAAYMGITAFRAIGH